MVTVGRSPRPPLRLGFRDVSRARLRGEAQRDLFARLPEEDGGGCAGLLRSMYGTQGADLAWQSNWSNQLEQDEWRMGAASPALIYRPRDEG